MAKPPPPILSNIPPGLAHLERLTTADGLIQHAIHEVPDPTHGYSIDDSARALIVCLWHYNLYQDPAVLKLADIYFNFLVRAQTNTGAFHNFVSFVGEILDHEGSEDSQARAVWALGETIALHPDEKIRSQARDLLEKTTIDRHHKHSYIRAKAYVLLGLVAAGETDRARVWADQLVAAYQANRSDDWQWFENNLRYANGILPYALAKAAILLNDQELIKISAESFDWLDTVSRENGVPAPIGQDGWYYRGQTKAIYDQQPLEAADMVLAAAELATATNDQKYSQLALEWLSWYFGHNTAGVSMIDKNTDGIFDGITPTGVNLNQGAESIVTYLLAYLATSVLRK